MRSPVLNAVEHTHTLHTAIRLRIVCLPSIHMFPFFSFFVVPSATPEVLIRNVTTSGIQVVWLSSRSRRQPILGYSINYRREHGEWRQIDCDPLSDSLWLDELTCGNNYSVYMTAYNHIGASLPSVVVDAKTKGRGKIN